MASHPLFQREAAHVRWVSTIDRLRQFSWRTLLGVHLAAFLVWALFALGQHEPLWVLHDHTSRVVGMVAMISFISGVVFDFVCISTALDSINCEILARRWDLLRMTALSPMDIFTAKHAAAQLRAWRTFTLVISQRLALVSLVVVLPLFMALAAGQLNELLENLIASVRFSPLFALQELLISAFAAAIFVLEPCWRMKALTAVGLGISSHVHDAALARLAGGAALVAIWLVQNAILVSLIIAGGFFFSIPFLMTRDAGVIVLKVAAGLWSLTGLSIVVAAIYGFYAVLQAWGLRRVIRAAA